MYYVDKKKNDKNLKQQILENTWYKLYLLQNYEISKDMFKGANLRWSSILTYLTWIRAIYRGRIYKNNKELSITKYIIGLMDSGVEPYPKINSSIITVHELIQQGLLTPYEIRDIFSSVGPTEQEVDTSTAWTCSTHSRFQTSPIKERQLYTHIITNLPTTVSCQSNQADSPSIKLRNLFNFVNNSKNLKDIYMRAFGFFG